MTVRRGHDYPARKRGGWRALLTDSSLLAFAGIDVALVVHALTLS
jgi:hypothetical protein